MDATRVESQAWEGGAWWGAWRMAPGEILHWRVGPLALWIECLDLEWRIHSRTEGEDSLAGDADVAVPTDPESLADIERQTMRISRGPGAGQISLAPVAADRSVVSRPQVPFSVPSDQEAQLFVSTPLWLRVQAEDQPLLELPIVRPSDTWFGPSTVAGELCYASRTHCRLEVDEIPLRPHRAVTAVVIRNQARSSLLLERLSVPVPYLSLFYGRDRHLWTQAISMKRADEREGLAELQIDKKAPFTDASLVSQPRARPSENLIVRAFSSLL